MIIPIKLFWIIVFGYIELNKFHMNLISVISNNFDALITVVVLIMSIILFIRNTIAPELTGLLCVGIFISTGVLSPEKALAGFELIKLKSESPIDAKKSFLESFKNGLKDIIIRI